MPDLVWAIVAGAWVLEALVLGSVMGRRGYEAYTWTLMAMFLGPLILPVVVNYLLRSPSREPKLLRSATTAAVTTTAPTTTPPPVPADTTALWPFPGSSTRFATPEEAARSFATQFLRFEDPQLAAFQAGDTRSGEVSLRPRAMGRSPQCWSARLARVTTGRWSAQ